MRKRMFLGAAAAAALALTTLSALPASAATGGVLTYPTAAGTDVSYGDVLSSPLLSGTSSTFLDSTGKGLTCTVGSLSATDADVTQPTAPGTATETLNSIAYTAADCTSNISGTESVKSITVTPNSATTTVTSADVVTVTGTITATVVLNLVIGTATCNYTAPSSFTGTAVNSNQSLDFSAVAFTKSTGWSGCPTTEYFTASYGAVIDSTVSSTSYVFVN